MACHGFKSYLVYDKPRIKHPKVITELKKSGELGRRCRCRPVPYLNNIVEQDHRAIKRRVRQPGFPVLPIGKADDSRHRDDEHDPEGTDKVVGQGRHRGANRVYFRITRTRRCCLTPQGERPTVSRF